MNTRRLRKIRDHILKVPKRVDMDTILDKLRPENAEWDSDRFPSCGTIGCIGGWALELYGTKGQVAHGSLKTAAKLLGMPWVQAKRLFFPENWPIDAPDLWPETGSRAYARNVAERIDQFIASKGEE